MRFFAAVFLLAACGGELGKDDAGKPSDAASDTTITASADASTDATAGVTDAHLPYVVIDGGSCDAPDGALWALETCCNGTLCQGQCVLYVDASDPTCLCAGVKGGCPGGWACCYSDDGTKSIICAATCPYHGPPK